MKVCSIPFRKNKLVLEKLAGVIVVVLGQAVIAAVSSSYMIPNTTTFSFSPKLL